jgi:hypothetical protein
LIAALVAARSVLRHIRVASKHELKQRILEFINDLNRDPVIHRWHYQIDAARIVAGEECILAI